MDCYCMRVSLNRIQALGYARMREEYPDCERTLQIRCETSFFNEDNHEQVYGICRDFVGNLRMVHRE